MNCASTIPWPCGSPIAGGNHALGSILCARHLAAILAPLKPPVLDRVALRRHHHASTSRETVPGTSQDRPLDPELIAAIVALAPLGATLYAARPWYPWYPRSDARLTCGELTDGFHRITPDDPAMPRGVRSAARMAVAAGWTVRVTARGDQVVVKCARDGAVVVLRWAGGHFAAAWSPGHERLGMRAAVAMFEPNG